MLSAFSIFNPSCHAEHNGRVCCGCNFSRAVINFFCASAQLAGVRATQLFGKTVCLGQYLFFSWGVAYCLLRPCPATCATALHGPSAFALLCLVCVCVCVGCLAPFLFAPLDGTRLSGLRRGRNPTRKPRHSGRVSQCAGCRCVCVYVSASVMRRS